MRTFTVIYPFSYTGVLHGFGDPEQGCVRGDVVESAAHCQKYTENADPSLMCGVNVTVNRR